MPVAEDWASVLSELMPRAIAWAEARENEIARTGARLNGTALAVAAAVGVARPERIRLSIVPAVPLPEDPELLWAATRAGLLGPGMIGLALGHGIYLRDGFATTRTISHECRHVYQYEQAGSIAAFLPEYLRQIITYGYERAPLEVDARLHERDIP